MTTPSMTDAEALDWLERDGGVRVFALAGAWYSRASSCRRNRDALRHASLRAAIARASDQAPLATMRATHRPDPVPLLSQHQKLPVTPAAVPHPRTVEDPAAAIEPGPTAEAPAPANPPAAVATPASFDAPRERLYQQQRGGFMDDFLGLVVPGQAKR